MVLCKTFEILCKTLFAIKKDESIALFAAVFNDT